jgi:CO/xanthine dehydrogenase Mo-binding subunit
MQREPVEAARAALVHEQAEQGVTRRHFLKLGVVFGAAAGGGLLVGVTLPARGQVTAQGPSGAVAADVQVPAASGEFVPNGFICIDRSGQVFLTMPKVEMGQGIQTAIPMLIAEELEVPLDQVKIEHAPPDGEVYRDPLLLNEHMTGGSSSIRFAWEPMRRAGAAGRVLLINAAAARWNVDPAACHADAGFVLHPASGRKLGYGELVEAAATLPVPPGLEKTVVLKQPADFKLIGKPHRRLDSTSKTNGTAQFGLDVRLPGMVYAAVVHSPVIGGKVVKVDDTHARKVPGVRQVVQLDNAVAVIGDHSWAARRGASALVIEWNNGDHARVSTKLLAADLDQAAQRDGVVARKKGNVEQGFRNAASKVDAVYRQPFLAHATMEPMNCTVHVTPGRVELWVGTQVPARTIDTAVRITGLPRDKITLHNFLIGGGFGRRLETDCTGQAIRIGQQVGAPVKVMWTREEDMQHDLYRPCYYDHISAALDANGKPVAWTHRIVGSSIVARFFGTSAMKNGLDFDAIEAAADLPYDIPNQFIDYVRLEPRNVPTTFWRGVGPTRGAMVVESFIDELAVNAKVDPVEYRRSLLGKSPRALNVLNVAAKAAGWGTPLPQGQGRGVSVLHAWNSYFSMVAHVTVINGEVRVNRLVCVVDCGHTVNPMTIAAQFEGGAIFGITAVLYSEITIEGGRVQQSNFTDYPMVRINEAPQIQVIIVDSTEAPGGMGEPGTAVTGPALLNAIYAATGKRIRQLPVGRQLQTP